MDLIKVMFRYTVTACFILKLQNTKQYIYFKLAIVSIFSFRSQ